ncbi:UDP-N-acetylmuramoyl-L-alanine--D-glutamate ligase [Massilicoli timonensis]|uniref:UDP-N-acetylmuramoyl-L-alanine--D-glutamate ligase n=1 Tax=Massilicoli timonensis TaxID=2015901 RepID=UPI00307A8A73
MKEEKAKVLVVGCGKSGDAVARLLIQKGAAVTITDQKPIPQKAQLEQLGITVLDGGHPESLKQIDWDYLVKNPGIPYHNPFIAYFLEKKVPIYTEVEIAYHYAKGFTYGAVTGTNGKTTITSLLYALLKRKKDHALVAGNIGYALSEVVLAHGEETADVAIELSNFQLLGIKDFHPLVSVVCNLAPDHLDYMKSEEAYYASKMKIMQNQSGDDWFLRNVDDATLMRYAKAIPCKIIDFSLERQDVDLYVKEGAVYLWDQLLFSIDSLQIVGKHNLANAMVAACMAYKMGVPLVEIRNGIAAFEGVEHRLEFCGERNGVRFYNDSKATNTDACETALSSFDGNVILLAGGYDKGISYDSLRKYDAKVKKCFAYGMIKDQFVPIFTHVETATDLKAAFDQAVALAQSGDVILLAPATSSYDQFANYEERGRVFKGYVAEYLKQG